jgi:hypothetical protein
MDNIPTCKKNEASLNQLILKLIVIPKEFQSCWNLESVIFEEGSQLQAIPGNYFSRCFELKSLMIPDAVTIIYLHIMTFWGCDKLVSI